MVNPSSPEPNLTAAQSELLRAVLASEAYPWQPDEAAESAAQLEAIGQLLEISDDEAAQAWQGISQQLSAVWSAGGESRQSEVLRSETWALQQKFGDRLPTALLVHIGAKAQQLIRSGQAESLSMVAQMVNCVQAVLTQVAEADLQVIARPMAVAMRGNSSDEFVEATIQSVRQADWHDLSPIEQARLSLAAARYAIAHTQKPQN
jgi:hypothetical protein